MYQKLLTHHIAVYSAHTNLDSADGGVNDVLAGLLGLTDVEGLVPVSETSSIKSPSTSRKATVTPCVRPWLTAVPAISEITVTVPLPSREKGGSSPMKDESLYRQRRQGRNSS